MRLSRVGLSPLRLTPLRVRPLRLAPAALRRLARDQTTMGVRDATRALLAEAGVSRVHRRTVAALHAHPLPPGARLDLGAGSRRRPGWLAVDLADGADLRLDLREPLPLRNGSVAQVRAEHLLEHLTYQQAAALLAEVRRVLAAGGRIDVGVPDTAWPVRCLAGRDPAWRAAAAAHGWHPPTAVTDVQALDWHARQGGEHRSLWDAETLLLHLRAAGFRDVAERQPGPDDDRPVGTVFATATATVSATAR